MTAGAAIAADPPIIDTHAHIFTPDMPLAASAWMIPDYAFTAEDYLATLDAHGVQFGVLAAVSIYGMYNDYMLAALRRHQRLRGTVNVDPTFDRAALQRMRDDGVVGMRLQLSRRTELPDFTTEPWQLLLQRVRDLDWHVHVALEGRFMPRLLPQLEAAGLRIVLDHFAHPDPAQGLEGEGFQAVLRSIDRGRTWVKLSAGFRLTWQSRGTGTADPVAMELAQATAGRLLREAGPERLVWGSDCPFVGHESHTYADALRWFEEWVPSAAVRRQMGDTALRLYFG
jgi:predicted TIM-barrel fold metal-dependent hydrolase